MSLYERFTKIFAKNGVEVSNDSVYPELPAEDGDYVLTVTISNGEPTFTWEGTESK